MKQFKMLVLAVACVAFTGCIKPYNVPEYVNVDTSETAYVIPLEGDGKDQSKFESEQYLESQKVALKRITVPKRWNQEGRMPGDGNWIPTIRVVKVTRSPETRQWGGSQGGKDDNHGDALWLQSSDGISFSIGFNCTSYIAEKDTSKFLYWYKGDSLKNVLDKEIKARYQQSASHVCATMKMDDLKSHTLDIVHAIEEDVKPFFAQRGITITTVGQFGGINYRDNKIMDAIESTYVAQQAKVNAAALLAAQTDVNKRVELEAMATAEKARTIAKGEADGIYEKSNREADGKLKLAQAEAEGIRAVTKAINEAGSSEGIFKLRQLEVQKMQAEKWQGGVPQFLITSGGTNGTMPTLILNTSLNSK